MKKPTAQPEKFIQAARELGTDESEESFDRVLKKVGKAKPSPAHKVARAKGKTRRP